MPISVEANAVLGLLAALLWGGGDFAGSISVRQAGNSIQSALSVILLGHSLSFTFVAALALHNGDPFPPHTAVLWGVGGGMLSGVSLVAFYLALADGHMGSAAAVSGLLCAAVPATVSAFTEGTPGLRRLLGFLFAGAAIWLIASSGEEDATPSRRALLLSTLSGIGFGVYFVSLKYTGEAGVLWPMVLSRTGSLAAAATLLTILFVSHPSAAAALPPFPQRWHVLAWIVSGAALDSGGNLSFIAATRAGRLDVAAVLASIYPASTILLAALVLKERTTPRQRWGMLLALPAVILITL